MEDAHAFEVLSREPLNIVGGIFDGHLGASVANRAAWSFIEVIKEELTKAISPESALRATMQRLHEEGARISQLVGGGACGVIFQVCDRDFGKPGAPNVLRQITTAHLGDAEAVFVSDRPFAAIGKDYCQVETLTTNHRLDDPDEILRIYHAGAVLQKPYFMDLKTINGIYDGRLSGQGLMPTRALGDTQFDHLGLSHEPSIGFLLDDAPGGYYRLHRPGYLIAACDGFWDVVKADELPSLIPYPVDGGVMPDAQHVADQLYATAMDIRGTTDNLSIIVVRVD